ncbi:MAG: LysM peptidoglycan-binding domain-containing protein [Candidatus Electrothrix sp. ATG2]|nr:LysM peptidoglycan-binding domain-containing protein [Candidatus Electrothrix sp. ATG2]
MQATSERALAGNTDVKISEKTEPAPETVSGNNTRQPGKTTPQEQVEKGLAGEDLVKSTHKKSEEASPLLSDHEPGDTVPKTVEHNTVSPPAEDSILTSSNDAETQTKADEKAENNKDVASREPSSRNILPDTSGNDKDGAIKTVPGAGAPIQPSEQPSDTHSVVPADPEQPPLTPKKTRLTASNKEHAAKAEIKSPALRSSESNGRPQGKTERRSLKVEGGLAKDITKNTPDKKSKESGTPPAEHGPDDIKNTAHHTVSKGDTLWKISEQYTGSGFNYPDVAQKNKIADPDLIYPNQQVKLPAKK